MRAVIRNVLKKLKDALGIRDQDARVIPGTGKQRMLQVIPQSPLEKDQQGTQKATKSSLEHSG